MFVIFLSTEQTHFAHLFSIVYEYIFVWYAFIAGCKTANEIDQMLGDNMISGFLIKHLFIL